MTDNPTSLLELAEQATELPMNHFIRGAQASREMLARFVENGPPTDPKLLATSIRANWHPGWGEDPGTPEAVAATWEPAPCPEGEKLSKRGRARQRGTKADLRRAARMIEKWGPMTEPANSYGQVSFTRAILDSTAECIRAFLRTRPAALKARAHAD